MWDKKMYVIGFGCLLHVLNASSSEEDYAEELRSLCIEECVTDSEVDYDELDCFSDYEELDEKILKIVEDLENYRYQISNLRGDMRLAVKEENLAKMEKAKIDLETEVRKLEENLMVLQSKRKRLRSGTI